MEELAVTYSIQSNIPIPDKRIKPPKYPFAKMKIHDSFEFDLKDIKKVSAAQSNFGKRHGKRFLVRRMGDKGRCWRMEEWT